MVVGMLVASEGWQVVNGSLEHVVKQDEKNTTPKGMGNPSARQRHVMTQIVMPMLDMHKPCHLDNYSGTILGWLTKRERPYSGDEMGHFQSRGVAVGWGEKLTADVACWATQLWAKDARAEETTQHVYWDWHVKTVYSDYHIPRTKHGTSDRIVGARKQLMLHDGAGHLLFLRTYRGDTHLIDGMVDGGAYYEGLAESQRLTHQIFDREGLSVAYFKELLGDEDHERQFTTCLKSNQYDGLGSFESCTPFEPYRYDKHGEPIQEIAEAKYEMPDRRKGEETLSLRAVLLRRPVGETKEKSEEGEKEARLFAIITSNWVSLATEIADGYRARQPQQENSIRDWWVSLGGNVNIGYHKHEVENSELAAQKEKLEARLKRLERYIPNCEVRLARARRRHQRYDEQYQTEWQAALQIIDEKIQQRGVNGEDAMTIHRWAQVEENRLREQLSSLQATLETAAEEVEQEKEKLAQYRAEREEKKQTLVEVIQQMAGHPMYELDNRKDQLVSALRLCLVNVLQLLRDTVFPESYARATYKTLAPFIQMGGFVIEHPDYTEVFFDGFWQSAKQRDLTEVVARCNAQQFTLPDGRRLKFAICSSPGRI
jgi:hypothetical protein